MADHSGTDQPGRQGIFSRLFGSHRKDLLSEHVLREIRAGRDLSDVMEDPFVRNRADDQQRRALLDDPQITAAVSDGVLADLRGRLDGRTT